MVQITKASADLPKLNFMVYADSGAGKTVFAASGKRVLFIAPEDNGIVSAVNLGYDPDKITIRNWNDFVAAYDYCYDNIEELAEKYDWFAIDSITKMQEICMTSILEDQRAERISKGHDPDLPQIQDYQKLYILVEKLVLAFNDLPMNIIYTALATSKEDPAGEDFLVPMVGSNNNKDYRVAMKCASHMTSYGYFKVEVVEKPAPTEEDPKKVRKVKQRSIFWEDTGAYRGKDRTTRLTPKTVLPARNALQFVSDIAHGLIDKEGRPVEAKKAPAKKAQPAKAAPKPQAVPADSGPVSQTERETEGDQTGIQLASVEA